MSTSTPLRKRRLLKNADESFTASNIVQDDETERQERRISLAPPRVSVNTEEFRSHFQLCQKMFIENKITPKNAWDLRIIDFFLDMINTHCFEGEPLQTAASALEICTKVYACRVDDLHAEGLKLANMLAAQKEQSVEENLDDDNAEAETSRKKKKKKPRLALNSQRFISKDVDGMLGPIPQLPSMPFNVQMEGDPEQTINLFTLTIPIDQNYHTHLRDKKNPCFLSYDQEDTLDEEPIEKFVPRVKGFKICKEFENFEVNAVDTDFNASMRSPNGSFAQHTVVEPVYDQNGLPIVELDGSIRDIFAEQDDDPIQDVEEELADGCHRTYQEVQIVSFCPGQTTADEQSALSISARVMTEWTNKIWVGPNHWKNKSLKRSVQRYSGTSEVAKKVVKKRKHTSDEEPIDFFADPPNIDLTAKVKPVRRVFDESKYLLPRNYLKRGPSDHSLMLMDYDLKKGYRASDQEYNHEYQNYNYDNLDDSQYCLANDAVQDDIVESAAQPVEEELEQNPIEPLTQTLEEEHIIGNHQQQPNDFNISLDALPCNPVQVPYAMQAKKVNMRRIKAKMLEILGEDKVLSENLNNSPTKIKSQSFSSIYRRLRMDLPKSIAQEMSIPIAYSALLHLTNEKSLTLKTSANYENIIISNENPPPRS